MAFAFVAFSFKHGGGFAAGLAVACGLCLFEGMCWVAATRHEAPWFPLVRWVAVSAMLAGSSLLTLVVGVMWMIQNWPVC